MFTHFIGSERSLGWVVNFWPVLLWSFVFSLGATWLCKKLALKLGIVDRPDDLVKTHKEPVAYLGGVGIMAGLFIGMLAGLYVVRDTAQFGRIFMWTLGIVVGGGIACAVGLIDDIVDVRPREKLLGQFVAAGALVVVGIRPNLYYFTEPLGLELNPTAEMILGIPVVIIFVLGATNSLNLLDGLDGLCAGVTSIITIAMLFLAVHLATWATSGAGDPTRVMLCLALVGGVLGFLPFNRHPAKIFMGDAGSMLLGFCIAALMILFAEGIPRWWMASIVVFGLPILDTATALVRRLLNKRPLMVSDRGHIYDQLMDRGLGLEKTVAVSYSLAGAYALIGVLMSQIRTRYALVVYVLVFVVSGAAVWKMGFLKMEGLRGVQRKKGNDEG